MKSFTLHCCKIFITAVLCAVLFSGCSFKKETKAYVLSDVYIGAQMLIDENKDTRHCEDIYLNEDGSLTLVLTESQRKRWADPSFPKMVLRGLQHAGINLTCSEDYTSIELSAPSDFLAASAPMLNTFVWYAELIQVLNGTEDWSVTVTLKDSETGSVVDTIHLPEEELDWSFFESAEP